jgi:hypothetical protein
MPEWLAVVFFLVAMGIAALLVGMVRDQADRSKTVRGCYRLIIVLTTCFWIVWLTAEGEVSTLRLLGLVLAFALPALLIAWWSNSDKVDEGQKEQI